MKKEFRVKSKENFAKVIKEGTQFKNNNFIVYSLNTSNQITRVGIAVSSKTGIAVLRNTAKRKLRALADELIDYNKGNKDIVIIAKSKFLNNSYNENLESLNKILKEIL